MRNLWLSLMFAALAGLGAGTAGAQQTSDPLLLAQPSEQVVTTILTVDLDRLFGQSQFGERIADDYNTGRLDLNAENRRIADALRVEELELAAQRPDMDPTVFRTEAEAFDEKAQGIRRAQDAKENALEANLEEGRAQFLEVSRPILEQLMVERGALAIVDRRLVLLSNPIIDVTDAAIQSINTAIGDGTSGLSDQAPGTDPEADN